MEYITRSEHEEALKAVWDRMDSNSAIVAESLKQTESLLSEVVKSTSMLSSAMISHFTINPIQPCQQHIDLIQLIEKRRRRFQIQTVSIVAVIIFLGLSISYWVKL